MNGVRHHSSLTRRAAVLAAGAALACGLLHLADAPADANAGIRPAGVPAVPRQASPKRKPPKRVPVNAAEAGGLYTVARRGTGLYYRKGRVLNVGVNVIEANLSDPNVRVAAMLSRGGIGTAESFGQMVQRARPAAAITGTFFGMRNRIPTGDLVINGHPVFRGFIGTAVAITHDNIVSFVPTGYQDQQIDWSRYETVMRGGPRLVQAGQIVLAAREEGFVSLPISTRRPRTAVAVTWDNRLQFVAVRQGITLWELAKVVRAIGAFHAVALDGGTSTALYFGGRHIARPGRGLTNVLLIYDRKERYEAMRSRLAGPHRTLRPAGAAKRPAVPIRPPAPPRPVRDRGFEPAQNLDFPLREAETNAEGAPR